MTRVRRKDRDYDLSLPAPLSSRPKTRGGHHQILLPNPMENESRHSFHHGMEAALIILLVLPRYPTLAVRVIVAPFREQASELSRTKMIDSRLKTLGSKSGQVLRGT